MVSRDTIIDFLDQELQTSAFQDSSLNGLQVEGKPEVSRVAVSVDSGLAVVQEAAKRKVELLIVHHGIFWSEPLAVRGSHREALSLLLQSGINLYASHLPLDAHMTHGNNAQLAMKLELTDVSPFFEYRDKSIGVVGNNSSLMTIECLERNLSALPGSTGSINTLAFGPNIAKRVGIVSGAGADALLRCQEHGIDTLVTGEPRQFAYHFARDNRLNVLFAGHYATETLGVQALAIALEQQFGLTWEFIDCPTGI